MKVKVWEWQKEEFELDLPETATVERLKREVAEHCNRPEEELILLLQGRALVDSAMSLQAEGVLNYDRIHLVVRQSSAPVQAAQSVIPPVQSVPKADLLEASPAAPVKHFGYLGKAGGDLAVKEPSAPFVPAVNREEVAASPAPLEAPAAKFTPSASKPSNFGYRGGNAASKAKVLLTGEAASEVKPPEEVPPTAQTFKFRPTTVVAPSSAGTSEFKPIAAAPTGLKAAPTGLKAAPTGLKAAPTPSQTFSSSEAVMQLTELGFSAAEAEKALESSGGDVELAASYLHGDAEPQESEGAQRQIEQLRAAMLSDPTGFDRRLKTDPQLVALEAQIPGGLKQFLQSRAPMSARSAPTADTPLTATDNSNIEQLVSLGFNVELAKAAYLRCGRNVEMAAEVLYSVSQQ